MAQLSRLAAASACAAAFSMIAGPVAAVELPRPAAASGHAPGAAYEGDYAENHRYRGYRYRDRIDAGDVLAGILILGTVAAVASAASNNRDRGYDRRAPYPAERQGYRRDYDGDGRGIDRAVGMCVDQIERGPDRVGSVEGANRTGEGWAVSGELEDGTSFHCRIDNMGRIRAIDLGGPSAGFSSGEDSQYGDDVYARARMSRGASQPGVGPADEVDNRPVWTVDRAAPADRDEGRYGISSAPDFEQG